MHLSFKSKIDENAIQIIFSHYSNIIFNKIFLINSIYNNGT